MQSKLDEKIKQLRECQGSKSETNTCMKCNEIFDCKLRKEYVISVFDSMNKGKTGGFNF